MSEGCVLHPNIKLHGTVAGRPSAANPNLQAVPKKNTVYRVKDVFIARPGYKLVSIDYSQAEVRLCAHLANDPALIDNMLQGGDMHQRTADRIKAPRDAAKRITFASIYGIGVPGLSQRLGIPKSQARKYLEAFHGIFTQIRPHSRELELLANRQGYIRLWTGRVRRYNEEFYYKIGERRAEPHKALSNEIQGGVAEMMRYAITNLDAEGLEGVHMLLQVHDQILFEVREDLVEQQVPEIERIMCNFNLKVPMKVDIGVGDRWGQLTDWGSENARGHSGTGGRSVRKRRKGRVRRTRGGSVRNPRKSGRT